MILKFQKSLASSEANPPVLVYNEGRTFETFLPLGFYKHFFEFTYKFYADCIIISRDEVVIKGIVDDQGW